jgi:hypothetical protein
MLLLILHLSGLTDFAGNELRALKELPLSAKSHLYDTSAKGRKIYWLLQESENGKVGYLEEAGRLLWEQITSPPDFSCPSLTPAHEAFNSLGPPSYAPHPENTHRTPQYASSGYNQPAGLAFDGRGSLTVPTATRMVDNRRYSGPYLDPHIGGAPTESCCSQESAQPSAHPPSWNRLPSQNSNTLQLPVLTEHQNVPSLPLTLNVLQSNTMVLNTHNIGQSQLTTHPTTQETSAQQQRKTFVRQDKTLPFHLHNAPYNSQPEVRQLKQNSDMNIQKTILQIIVTLPKITNPSASSRERPINTTSTVGPPGQPHPPSNAPDQKMTEIPQHQSQIPAQTPPIIRRSPIPFKRSFEPSTNNVQATDPHPVSNGGIPLKAFTSSEEHMIVIGAEAVGNGEVRVPCDGDDQVAKKGNSSYKTGS